MALTIREYLHLTILIRISIGISSVLAWNPSINRYESYDLERGPVFYEAYYPDNTDESRNSFQEKRYFDRDAVLERSYQVPANGFAVSNDALRVAKYQNAAERYHYPNPYVDPKLSRIEENQQQSQPSLGNYNSMNNYMFRKRDTTLENVQESRVADHPDPESLDIKEISNLARRAISRDLENWNALEDYLDRAKYQEPVHQRRTIDPGYDDLVRSLRNGFKEERGSSGAQSASNLIRRLTPRDLAGKNSLEAFDPIWYRDQQLPREEFAKPLPSSKVNSSPLKREDLLDRRGSIVDPYPPEDIFQPRPQVINYVFSKKSSKPEGDKVHGAETKDTPEESIPRNYGDNLIRQEMEKTTTEETKDKEVKVTSIEISEVPRHKTRHHHGERPKRDYSHRHQS